MGFCRSREWRKNTSLFLFPSSFHPATVCITQRASQITATTPASPSYNFLTSSLVSLTQQTPPLSKKRKGKSKWLWTRYNFSVTMEIQSGNGEEVASAVSATSGFVSRSPSGSLVETSDNPACRMDPQASKRIERFDIPLDSLKRMFEKPAGANTVSTATVHLYFWPTLCLLITQLNSTSLQVNNVTPRPYTTCWICLVDE